MTRKGARRPQGTYGKNVFLNCPFDELYMPLFRALVFTIQDCGFAARCALEVEDSGEARATKILRLIKESQFGIHDISRTELSSHNNLPRFNMPFELGLFVGLKYSEDRRQQRKRLLVLDTQPYRYQQFLSDIAGQDIRSHDGNEESLIQQVRHWLQNQTERSLLGVERIVQRFHSFQSQIPELLGKLHKSERDLENYVDFHNLASAWIVDNPQP
jgi:hypothetical protein